MRHILIVTAVLGVASVADAQVFLSERAGIGRGIWSFDIGGRMAQPVGEFRTNVSRAWGGGAAVRYQFGRMPALGIRGDLALLNYGSERKRVPLSPTVNRVVVQQNTTNNIGLVTIGPELMVPSGPIRPYIYGFGGWSQFYTESSAEDEDQGYSFASSTNFSDGGGTAGWGGGIRVPLRVGRGDVFIDGGARFTKNWTRSYLKPGDVMDQPDGSLTFNERRTVADFWQFHLGASFAPSRSRR
jgi:hypothetical protein